MQPTLLPQNEPSHHATSIAPLATLPVFLPLTGKRAVISGGSDAAAWKTELLLAAGAHAHVHCPPAALGEAMRALLARKAGPGALHHHPHPWHIGCFQHAALAIADCDSEAEARAFACAARDAGVAYNVIDKPDFCQFQFGAIVNRSPLVVSISTDGAAPILGQAVRRRIETLLPPGLQDWTELARGLRGRVNALFRPGPERRAFWEQFVDKAFAAHGRPDPKAGDALLSGAARLASQPTTGRVTLVGAGPGDAELLTLKAVRALQSADIILFDDLVSADVLELARREARRMLVGKRGGRDSCRQEDINDHMVRFAKAGKHVVRLKSGDPAIFGRAGEEIARLEEEGIPVEIVPGITSASTMAARLGVSLTHRDHAQSVRFVTAHSRHGQLPDNLDWSTLADPTVTTIFYMGGRMAGRIAERLAEAGMALNTPSVAMSAIARAEEQRWIGPLGALCDGVNRMGLENPVLIGIGDAFKPAMAKSAPALSSPAEAECALRQVSL